jgi:hypothetical protein
MPIASSRSRAVRSCSRALGCLSQLEPLQQLGSPVIGLGPVQVVEAASHDQVLLAGEVVVHRGGLAGQADHLPYRGGLADHVEASHPGVPAIGAEQRGQNPYGGGLAGPVGAEQSEDAAGWDHQVHVLERADVPVRLGKSLGENRRCLAHPQLPSSVAIASVTTHEEVARIDLEG